MVNTDIVKLEDDVMEFFDNYRALGYEGAMLRNSNSIYENKRSYNLLKVKEFDDAEFKIVGIEEGEENWPGMSVPLSVKRLTARDSWPKLKVH